MKNVSRIVITFAIILTMFVVSTPSQVGAQVLFVPIPFSPEIAPGSWSWTTGVSGYEIQPGTLTAKAPAWRLIKTNGLVLSGPAYLCHEFTGDQVGWIADIYMLEGNSWSKLVTTIDWVPTVEGKLLACAQAPTAGTFALFAYWVMPEGWNTCVNPFSILTIDVFCSRGIDPCCISSFPIR